MKKVKTLLAVAGLLFFTAGVLTVGMFINRPTSIKEQAAASTNLFISPTSQNISPGQDLTFSVAMDTGTNSVTGLDMELNFDPNIIQVSSIKKGAGVTSLNNTITSNFDNTNGKIFYAIFTLDKSTAVQGSGIEVLQVKAKAVSNATVGNYLLSFDPSTAVSATSESQNALLGTSPGTLTVVIATPVPTATASPRPTATATDMPTNAPGQPNSCGGTCGSNFNCAANLYCYQGYCRNPSCAWSTDCSCNANQTATPVPTATRIPVISSRTTSPAKTTPPVIVKFTASPKPTPTPNNFWENIFNGATASPLPSTTPEPAGLPASNAGNFLPWIIGSLIVAGITLIFIVIGILKEASYKKPKPPLIKV